MYIHIKLYAHTSPDNSPVIEYDIVFNGIILGYIMLYISAWSGLVIEVNSVTAFLIKPHNTEGAFVSLELNSLGPHDTKPYFIGYQTRFILNESWKETQKDPIGLILKNGLQTKEKPTTRHNDTYQYILRVYFFLFVLISHNISFVWKERKKNIGHNNEKPEADLFFIFV